MGAAGFGGSFDPIVQYEKWEIHKVFPHFPYFRLGQNISPNLLAPLCGVALRGVVAMTNEKVFAMSFAKVYPMLIAKAERKGRTRDDVLAVTAWLTGYTNERLEELLDSDITYGDFFRNAPALNPARKQIKGSVCGVKVETIEDPLMQEIRYLDKLVDELAKGKPMEKIMR